MPGMTSAAIEWLTKGALYEAATDAAIAAAWGVSAIEAEIVSPLAAQAAAVTEAARQQGFWAGPLVIDRANVPGLQAALLARPIQIFADTLDYQTGPTVFVIFVEEDADVKRTLVTVLRRLP